MRADLAPMPAGTIYPARVTSAMALTGLDRPDLADLLGMTVRDLAVWETHGRLSWVTTGQYRALADAADVMPGWFCLPPPPSAVAACTRLCAGPDHGEFLPVVTR